MKKKHKTLILIIGTVLLVSGIIIFLNRKNPEYYLRKEVTGILTNIRIENFSSEKIGILYNVTADLIKDSNVQFECNEYSIYLLDKQNNLIYLIDGSRIGNFDVSSDLMKIDMDIEYEISSVDSMKIIKKEYGYKFNKDLRSSLKKIEDNRVIYSD